MEKHRASELWAELLVGMIVRRGVTIVDMRGTISH